MTVIEYDSCMMAAKGHAGYAEHGKDIVCASVSMLMATLAEVVLELEEEGKLKAVPVVKLEPGYSIIACKPAEEMEEKVTFLFESIYTGMQMLAENYPKNVVINPGNPVDIVLQ